MTLELTTPVTDRYSNHLKKVVFDHFQIRSNLEMSMRVAVVWYENINGTFGRPLLQVIDEDLQAGNITAEFAEESRKRYRTTYYTSDTAGTFVNATTGEKLLPDENGNLPEGAIAELQYWQGIPHVAFSGTTLADKIYNALKANMTSMATRGRV